MAAKNVSVQKLNIQDVLVWEEENMFSRANGHPAATDVGIGQMVIKRNNHWEGMSETEIEDETIEFGVVVIAAKKGEMPSVIVRHAIIKFDNLVTTPQVDHDYDKFYDSLAKRGLIVRQEPKM